MAQNTESKLVLGGREIRKRKYGNCDRLDFSRIENVLEIPDLVEIQKNSYKTFLEEGVKDVLDEYSPICDYSGKIELHFLGHSLETDKIKYGELECKNRDATYSCPLKVNVRLINKETGEIKDQEVFMGDLPLMTPNGSFIINGAERVIVSQLVRSPGVYCDSARDKNGEFRYATTIIPTRGAWLEFEEDAQGILYVHVDRTRKVSVSILLRCLGIASDEEILSIFHDDPVIKATCEHDVFKTQDEALVELNKRLRPGEVPTTESVKAFLNGLLFDSKKYDLARVGRYKFNKKLALFRRITGCIAAQDVKIGSKTVVKAGETISEAVAVKIQNAGINEVAVQVKDYLPTFVVRGNNTVDLAALIDCDPKALGILEKVHYPTLMELWQEENAQTTEQKLEVVKAHAEELCPKHIIIDDILSAINYNVGLHAGVGYCDNIDHLGNRRVRSVGELLQNQFRIGIVRLERVIKERMQIQDIKELTPQSLINIKPVSSAIKEFFGSSQLSQFMDQTNPISELTHKRKLSALGPGGLNRERASFDVRDVHYTHYGRICPIETPEGQNIGLISSLAGFARVNEYGFIEAPYRKVVTDDKGRKRVSKVVEYMSADDEDRFVVAQANSPLDENDWFSQSRVMVRSRDLIAEMSRDEVDYMDVSPRQLVSVATALVPFLENDDTNRALMGSNMQRQAVPLLKPEAPIIATGVEDPIAYDSGVMVIADHDGVVEYVDADKIIIKRDDGDYDKYELLKFKRSNQGTCLNQHPIVKKGDRVQGRSSTLDANGNFVRIRGTVLADGHSTQNAELALGRNILIGFMSWEGYNYEDAILISEDLIKEDVFTSIHIEEYEMEARDTKLGPEEITRDIPNVGEDALKDLDEEGVIRVGATVRANDILVGKVTPKGETDLTPEERLLRAIFGEKARDVRDTSLRVPHGEGGVVVDVKVFTRANKDELKPGVHKLVRVYIAQKRKISVGDKMAGRHGNKGVISRVLPREDMPFMADGTPLQIVLNPLGVPSRMNIGQVLEVHLGMVAKANNWHIATPIFDGAKESDIKQLFMDNGIVNDGKVDGKIELFDGRTGQPFENRVTVGYMYMLKLIHLVDDKIHARSTGPYSLVTQQPLGGKAQFGGQRFGEMEVWALYAYGAANILQEIMTIKSDDVVGRVKAFDAIVKGENIPEPGVPESFKVLIKELQSLGLDIKVLSDKKEELNIKDLIEDDVDLMNMDLERHQALGEFENGELSLDIDDFEDDEDDVSPIDDAETPGDIFGAEGLDFVDDFVAGDLAELEDDGEFGDLDDLADPDADAFDQPEPDKKDEA